MLDTHRTSIFWLSGVLTRPELSTAKFVDDKYDNVPSYNTMIRPPEHMLARSKASFAGDIWGVGTVVSMSKAYLIWPDLKHPSSSFQIVTMLLNRPRWVPDAVTRDEWYSTIRSVIGDVPEQVRETYEGSIIEMIERKSKSKTWPALMDIDR